MDHAMDSERCNSNEQALMQTTPELRKFQATDIYQEIRAFSGQASHNPDRWSLVRALQQRENGIASPHSDTFSKNQERYITNLYTPNKMSTRLMSLGAKVIVTKFNHSGGLLLTASADKLLRINDGDGKYHLLNRIRTHGIIDADFSPCGHMVAYASKSRPCIYIMDVGGCGHEYLRIDLSKDLDDPLCIRSLRYSPAGDKIFVGSNHPIVLVADLRTQSTQILRTHQMETTFVTNVCSLHDEEPNVIIVSSGRGILKAYDLRTSFSSRDLTNSVATFIGHSNLVTCIDSRNDGYHWLSNSTDESIKIWDIRVPSKTRNHGREIMDDNLWIQLQGGPLDTSIMTYRGHRLSRRAKFSPLEQTGQRYIYTGCDDGRIIIYDVLTGKIKENIVGHTDSVRDLDWHPERPEIVSGSFDTHVHLNSFSPTQ